MRWLAILAVTCCACSDFIDYDDASFGDDATGPNQDVVTLPLDATIPGDGEVEADLFDASAESDAPLTCAQLPDGTPCKQAPDLCHTDGVCKAGVCTAPGTHVDGYNWDPNDPNARCCGGTPVKTTSNANCGACGIQCNAGNGESCSTLGGHYFCRGCIASASCWSHCCSQSFSPPSCAASDCVGNCSAKYCPPGTHCVVGGGTSSDYCAY
jgi:hypothetical protein